VAHPSRVARLAVLASTAQTTADQIAANSLQRAAIQMDPAFAGGDYYEADAGEGPHRGLALARRMALMTYRASDELNGRFARSWQSDVSPLGDDGRFSVESYLDFHGNKFTRRFDASSYVTLTHAMDSHDVGAGRGGVAAALARRMAMLNYRTATELNSRFERSWQSGLDPLGGGGRFAVESYLDFHGNRFTRRFDANSYIVLTQAMNSHDVGRDRGGVTAALDGITASSLVLGIDSDRYFSLEGQVEIASRLHHSVHGADPIVLHSEYGHDAFLIEHAAVGAALRTLLAS